MAGEKGIVLVDLDNTAVDFDGPATDHIDEPHPPRTHFYIADDFEEAERAGITATYHQSGFFRNLEVKPGFLEAWDLMLRKGFDPVIASSPILTNPEAVSEKKAWLSENMARDFGEQVVKRALFDRDKWKIQGTLAIIDDRPNLPTGPNTPGPGDWEQILFGWKHLSTKRLGVPSDTIRILSWDDPDLDLPEKLEAVRRRKEARFGADAVRQASGLYILL